MINTLCLRCLTHGHRRPVTLTGGVYRCPHCGFVAAVRRVKLSDVLWGRETVKPGRVWWIGGEAHCVERISQ